MRKKRKVIVKGIGERVKIVRICKGKNWEETQRKKLRTKRHRMRNREEKWKNTLQNRTKNALYKKTIGQNRKDEGKKVKSKKNFRKKNKELK